MKKAFIFCLFTGILILFAALGTTGFFIARDVIYSSSSENVRVMTEAHAYYFEHSGDVGEDNDGNFFIMVADLDGNVLIDTSSSGLSSIAGEADFLAAKNGSSEVSESHAPFSETVFYYSVLVNYQNKGYIVRGGLHVGALHNFILIYIPMVCGGFVLASLGAALVVSLLLKKRSRPLEYAKEGLLAIANGQELPEIQEDSPRTQEVKEALESIQSVYRKKISEALSMKEGLEQLLEKVADGIVLIDDSLDISYLNKAAGRMFGLKERAAHHVDDLPLSKEDLHAIESRQGLRRIINVGTKHYVFSYTPIEGGGILLYSDITLEVDLEKMRSGFFASASHELKTPIAAIKGYGELALLQDDGRLKAPLEGIVREEERLERLVEDMLWLYRLESEDPKPKGPISLATVTESAFLGLDSFAVEKSVSLQLEGECLYPMEERHAASLITNLVSNSIKYGRQNGRVKVVLYEKHIEVIDDGIGLKRGEIDRIFERFYRVEEGGAIPGTGLGLSIVKHIVRAYKGEILCSSVYGEGTKMEINLP